MNLDEAVERATAVAHGIAARHADEVDHSGSWPEESIRACQQAGLGGLVVPTEAGGPGLGLLGVTRVCEVLGQACGSTALSFGMHLVGSAVLAAKATPDQRDRYLEPIARGEHLTTIALSEPGTGSHFYIPETRLDADEEGYRVSGTKSFVTNGGHADSYVATAVTGSGPAEPGEFSCFIVPADARGLSWGGPWRGWGMRGNSARTVTFEQVRVSREDLLGREGDQIWYVFHVIAPFFLMAMTGTYIGIAAAAVEEARQHLQRRVHTHTGSTLAHSSVLQHRLGSLWSQVQRTRAFMLEAAALGDRAHPQALPALCSAKAEAADAAERVAADVMTLMGGRGYAADQPIQRLYRDARAAHVMAPTTEILRIWTGRTILGLPMLGE